MMALPLNEEQRDCLQELTNVAMGVAAESLAAFTQLFVCLPIPVIRYTNAKGLVNEFDKIKSDLPSAVISREHSLGEVGCHSLFIIGEKNIHDLMTVSNQHDKSSAEYLKAVFESISQSCFDHLGEMFGTSASSGEVVIHGLQINPNDFVLGSDEAHQKMLAIEINYHFESYPFSCNLLLLFPQSALAQLFEKIDCLLE